VEQCSRKMMQGEREQGSEAAVAFCQLRVYTSTLYIPGISLNIPCNFIPKLGKPIEKFRNT